MHQFAQRCKFTVCVVYFCIITQVLLSNFVKAIPIYSPKNPIVNVMDYQKLSPLPYNLADFAVSEMCVVENGDVVFRDTTSPSVLKRYYASNKTVAIYLGKGNSTSDGVDTTNVLATVKYLTKLPSTGECVFYDANNKVRVISKADNTVRTIASIPSVTSITFDEFDNMYTIESSKIRKLNYTSGNLIAFAGGSNTNTIPADGSPASGNLKTPTTILSRNGTMYFSVSHSIMKVENGCFYRISGSWATCTYNSSYDGTASSACLSSPKLISVIDGEIYFSDKSDNYIRKITKDGLIMMLFGTGGETLDFSRTDQKLQDVILPTVKSMRIVPMGNYFTYYIAFNKNIVKVEPKDSKIECIAGRSSVDFSYSVYKYGFQSLSLGLKPIKTYRNGDYLLFSSDTKTLYKLSRRTGLLTVFYVFSLPVSDCVVDKITKEDLYLVNNDVDNSGNTHYYINKFNIYSKSLQLIAGNSSATDGYLYDGQSSLSISIKSLFYIQFLNSSIFYSNEFRIMQLNLSDLTVRSVFGVGYINWNILAGLNSPALNVELNSLNQITANPVSGTLCLRTRYLISCIDEHNIVRPLVGRNEDTPDFTSFPAPAGLITTSLETSPMAFHPVSNNLYFAFNSYLLEYVNSTYIRKVFGADSTIGNLAFRNSTGHIYYSTSTGVFDFNPSTGNSSLIIPDNSGLSLICMMSDDKNLAISVKNTGVFRKFNVATLTEVATVPLHFQTGPSETTVYQTQSIVCLPNNEVLLGANHMNDATRSSIIKINSASSMTGPVYTPSVLTFSPKSLTLQNGSLIISGDNGIFKANGTTITLIAGHATKVPYENYPISENGWTINSNGDIYFVQFANLNYIKKAVKADGYVIDVLGSGTTNFSTKFTPSTNVKLSDFTSDGCYYGETFPTFWYDSKLDKYFTNVTFGIGSSTFTRDEDILMIEKATNNGLSIYNIPCDRDKYGYCLQNFNCFGIFYNNDSSCSGRGDCTSFNGCECFDNYYSENCSITTCNGIMSNESNVCSSHGQCVDFDACECQDDYSGSDCNITSCFGLPSSDVTVCSGNGSCIAKDICNCILGHFGLNCNETVQNNVTLVLNNTISNTSLLNDTLNSTTYNQTNVTNSQNNTNFGNSTVDNNSTINSTNIVNTTSDFSNSTNLNDTTNMNTTSFNETLDQNSTNSTVGNNSSISNSSDFGNSTNFSNHSLVETNNSMNSTNVTMNSNTTNSTLNNTLISNSTTTVENSTNSTIENKTSINNSSDFGNSTNFQNHSLVNETWKVNVTNSTLDNNSTTNATLSNNSTIDSMHNYNATNITSNSINNSTIGNNTVITNTANTKTNSSTIIYCYGYVYNDSRVCSGHGICLSENSCQCSQLYEGSNCESKKITCFGIPQSDPVACSANGLCLTDDTCKCNNGFIGSRCFSTSSQPPNFNSLGNTLEFHINTSTINSNRVLDCNKVIGEKSISFFGNNPSCYWKDGSFFIELGGQFTLTPYSNVSLNINALDIISISNPVYISLLVLPSNNPVKPIINVSFKNTISPCEQISIDASGSYCGDLKPVKFVWSIESSPDTNFNLQQVSFSNFNSTLVSNSISIAGKYIFGLIAESSLSGARSEKQLIEISKSDVPNPTLSLLTSKISLINIEKSSLPLIIKKSIELPSCYFENKQFKYIWEQISGPLIDYQIDSNSDLVIKSISTNGDTFYIFSVKAISIFNSNSNTSMLISLSSKSKDLVLNIFASNLNTNQVEIVVEYSDPDNVDSITDSWNWSCFDRVSNQVCQDSTINNVLTQCSLSKSTSCIIPKSTLSKVSYTLTIQIGSRTTSKLIEIGFPITAQSVPPMVNLISVTPNRFKVLKDELLSLQLSVILGGDEKLTNEEDLLREWSINGNLLSEAMTSRMSVTPEKSSSLILSLSELLEDGDYEILLKVSDRRNTLSTTFSYKFKIVKSPKSCLCYINPLSGFALETKFSFSCPGCQNVEQSIDFVFGFIDDKSGTKIPLYNLGEKFASYLPSPYLADNMNTFVDIVDLDTGASVEFIQSVEVKTPVAVSISQIKSKVKNWQSYAASLLPSDSAKLIFNSATISRTSELMISKISNTRRIVNTDQDIVYDLRNEMLESMILGLNQRNPLEQITDIHFRVYSFGLEALAFKCESIDSIPFEKLFNLTEKIIDMASYNSKFRVADGVDKLINSLLDSIIRLLTKSANYKEIYRYRVLNLMKKFSSVLMRNFFVGQKEYTVNMAHYSKISLLKYKNQLNKMEINTGNSSVLIDGIDSIVTNRQVLGVSLLTVEDYLGVSEALNQEATIDRIKVSDMEEIETKTSYKLLSNIISIDKKFQSDIFFMTKLSNYNISNINVKNSFEVSTATTIRKATIISNLECVPIENIFSSINQSCSITISSVISCNCSKSVTSVVIIEKMITNTTITQLESEIIPPRKESNLELYGLFGLFALLAVCCCGIMLLIVIGIVYCRKKKQPKEISKQREVELLTV